MTTEAPTQQLLRVRAAELGCALWRNNSGAVTAVDARGIKRPVRFGVGNDSTKLNKVWKSSDLVGIGPGGRFLAVEVKHPRWTYKGTEREVAQLAFIENVKRLGGHGFFCTSVYEFEIEIRRMEQGES